MTIKINILNYKTQIQYTNIFFMNIGSLYLNIYQVILLINGLISNYMIKHGIKINIIGTMNRLL